jgi:hypothetical protein
VQQWFSLWMWIQTKQICHNKWIIKSDHMTLEISRIYYYVKKVLKVVRLVINIRVKERVYSVFKNKVHIILMQWDAWYKTWCIRGVSYAILLLGNSCSVLPSLETFHSTTTTKKNICLFTDVAIHEVAWYVIKKNDNETAVLPNLNRFSQCY